MEVHFNVHYEFGSLKFFLKKTLSFREKSEITGMHPTLHNY